MKLSKIAACAALCAAAASCCKTANIQGTLAQAPESQVVVKLLDINTYKILDTVATDAAGRFSYKVPVEAGQPEFVYVFYGDTKIASLLLEQGDKVTVTADTLGNYTVEGSPESTDLQTVEKNYADFVAQVEATLEALPEDANPEQVTAVNRAVSKEYVDYYRQAAAYVVTHQKSLTSVPVLFQNVNAGFPVFNQPTDAIHFRAVADTLKQIYPDSKYVKALDREATRRESLLNLNTRLSSQPTVNFPDISLPDINGQKVSLAAVDAKVILLYFWTASDAAHKMFNVDTLLPLYEQFHDRGFEIYSVDIDVDKATWAASVRNQKLPWINVCDGLGTACPALGVYNVSSIPTAFLIKDGALTTENISGTEDLGNYLRRIL